VRFLLAYDKRLTAIYARKGKLVPAGAAACPCYISKWMIRRRCIYLLACGAFLMAACQASKTPSGPTPLPEPNSIINYIAIGASDAVGFGSSVQCVPFGDCPNGKGYVPEAARLLRAKGFVVNLANYGIPTAVIGRDFQTLGAQYGRDVYGNFIENEAPFVTPTTTLVTIFAGGNDVNIVTAALGRGAGASNQIGYINGQVKAFGDDYTALLKIIRDLAPGARIVVLNLPNMAGMPFLANVSLQQRQAAQKLSVGMTTTVINPLTSQGVLVVDLMCDARAYQASTYSSDGFHPSDAGYAWMAGEVVAAATTGYKAPAGSCSHMIVVPN
jgi:lysophospholipase L1-like esterase